MKVRKRRKGGGGGGQEKHGKEWCKHKICSVSGLGIRGGRGGGLKEKEELQGTER